MAITIPYPQRQSRPILIALLVALLIHSLLFLSLEFNHAQQPIKQVKKQKPLMIEFIGAPKKKPQPIPKNFDRLAEINHAARVEKKLNKIQKALSKLAIQPSQARKKSAQQRKQSTPKSIISPVKKKRRQKGAEPTQVPDVKKITKQVERKKTPEQLKLAPALLTLAQRSKKQQKSSGENRREATVDLNTKQFKFAYYFGALKRAINMEWIYPLQARLNRTVGVLLLSFSIDQKGELISVVVIRSSGRKLLDQAAVSAIRQAAPFPPLPKDWQLEKLNISVNFEYILRK
jgi:periplasmic protein TonB